MAKSKQTNQTENFIILYQDENGLTRVDVRFAHEDVWLNQDQLAEICCTTQQNVSSHIRNIYADSELSEETTHKIFLLLAVYFAIGKYLSKNTRNLEYGAGGIKAISEQLLRELPGLRGYSATQLNEMRRFYEAWQMLDAHSSVVTDKSQHCSL